jgi:nucleotidyltransferase/DNA polymerase involved in DNA repair
MSRSAVLLVDIDCFFVQIERHDNPLLVGAPVAVQQHQDVISVSYEARLELSNDCLKCIELMNDWIVLMFAGSLESQNTWFVD